MDWAQRTGTRSWALLYPIIVLTNAHVMLTLSCWPIYIGWPPRAAHKKDGLDRNV